MNVKIDFKTGSFPLHPNPNFNYQLNRTYAWSNGDLGELKAVAAKITDAETWGSELLKLADDGDPAKIATYEKAVQLFYDYHAELFAAGVVKKVNVPFESGHLPVLYTAPANKNPIDTLLLHGGYDSYMEEFLPMLLYLRENGFAGYLFEGPGQGGVLRKQRMTFIPEWEKPVQAILDHFGLDGVTIVGLSLGGSWHQERRLLKTGFTGWPPGASFPIFLILLFPPGPKVYKSF
jgi:hypothetical protein